MLQHIIFPWDVSGWGQIREKLQQPITSIADFDMRIVNIHNGKYKARTIIDAFNKYYGENGLIEIIDEKTVVSVVEMAIRLILDAGKTFKGVKLYTLTSGITSNQTLSRLQVATLISCALFGLFTHSYVSRGQFDIKSFSDFNLLGIFISGNVFAMQCVLRYFQNVMEYTSNDKNVYTDGQITIMRKRLQQPPDWITYTAPISEIYLSEDQPDTVSKLSIDYATEWLCQDIFTKSLTHEEIQFLVRPECLISVLICARLGPLDAITILGAERMSGYTGIGTNVRYTGAYNDESMYGYISGKYMLQHAVISIDATHNINAVGQFITDFDRDLNKAFCGMSMLSINEPIASGNWCHGPYGGNHLVKFIQLILAASAAGKPLIYTPSISDFKDSVDKFATWVIESKMTVGEVYKMYKLITTSYIKDPANRLDNLDIFDYMIEMS